MRIALVSSDWIDFSDGGIATLSAVLAGGLHEAGVHVEVWTRGSGPRQRALAVRAAGSEAHPFVVHGLPGRSWGKRGDQHWRRGLGELLPEFQPDVVILTTWEPLSALTEALQCGGLERRPEIAVMAHGRDVTGVLDSKRSSRREHAWRADVRWLVLSPWLAGELCDRGVSADRIVVVPAAVPDCPRRGGRPKRPPTTLMTVGRLIPRKGQDVVIAALALLVTSRPTLRYLVVGEGPDRSRLKKLVRAHGVEDRVELCGWLPSDELERAWERADLFVMPAREELDGDTEGYGLVYLEAGARGLAGVGGRSGGVPAAVRPGDNGELLEDPRAADELAQLLDVLLADSDRRLALAAGGRRAFEERGRSEHLAEKVCQLFSFTQVAP